jgi:hypothetical protein
MHERATHPSQGAPQFPLNLTVSRSDDWLSDGVLVAHRRLPVFASIHASLDHDGVWRLGSPPVCCAIRSGLQNHADELCREPLHEIVLHMPTDASTGVPELNRIVPARWQWEALTAAGSYVFDGRIAIAAMHQQPTGWWWRMLFAWDTVPTLVGGLGHDRLFFLAGIMPAELVGADA